MKFKLLQYLANKVTLAFIHAIPLVQMQRKSSWRSELDVSDMMRNLAMVHN